MKFILRPSIVDGCKTKILFEVNRGKCNEDYFLPASLLLNLRSLTTDINYRVLVFMIKVSEVQRALNFAKLYCNLHVKFEHFYFNNNVYN